MFINGHLRVKFADETFEVIKDYKCMNIFKIDINIKSSKMIKYTSKYMDIVRSIVFIEDDDHVKIK